MLFWDHTGTLTPIPEDCLDPDELAVIVRQARGANYLSLLLGQFFHIWMCRFRHARVWDSGFSFFSNPVMFFGCICQLAIMVIVLFVPELNYYLGCQPPPWWCWLPPVVGGAVLWIYVQIRLTIQRYCPESIVSRCLSW